MVQPTSPAEWAKEEMVPANPSAPDDLQAGAGRVDQFAVHAGAAAGDQGVVLRQAPQRLGAVQVALVIDLEALMVQVAGVHLVADQNAQGWGLGAVLAGGQGLLIGHTGQPTGRGASRRAAWLDGTPQVTGQTTGSGQPESSAVARDQKSAFT